MQSLTVEMRVYLLGQLPQVDGMKSMLDSRSTKELQRMIASIYVGGLDQWMIDYMGRTSDSTADNEELATRSFIVNDLNFRLQQSEKVISFSNVDGEDIVIGIETTVVKETFGREREIAKYLSMYVGTTACWSRDRWHRVVHVQDTDFEGQVYTGQYSVLNTPERFAEKMDQYLECYRPGTSNAPMDGPKHDNRMVADMKDYYSTMELGLHTLLTPADNGKTQKPITKK